MRGERPGPGIVAITSVARDAGRSAARLTHGGRVPGEVQVLHAGGSRYRFRATRFLDVDLFSSDLIVSEYGFIDVVDQEPVRLNPVDLDGAPDEAAVEADRLPIFEQEVLSHVVSVAPETVRGSARLHRLDRDADLVDGDRCGDDPPQGLLGPRREVGGTRPQRFARGVVEVSGPHEIPLADALIAIGAAARVVEVRESQRVAELMAEGSDRHDEIG